jgi:hypothetical protein
MSAATILRAALLELLADIERRERTQDTTPIFQAALPLAQAYAALKATEAA